MKARRRRDRAERVVRGDGDVVCLAPAGDLARLGKAANIAQVDAGEVDPVIFNSLTKLPLRGPLLTHRDRDGRVLAEPADRRRVLAADRVFDKERAERFQFPAEHDGVDRVEPRVDIDDDFRIGSDRVADFRNEFHSAPNGSARFQTLASLVGQVEADELPAGFDALCRLLGHPVELAIGHMRVADDFVADQAAQQFVAGHAEGFAFDVPQGDVDRTDRGGSDAAAREEAATQHDLPQVLGPHRVFANQRRRERVDEAGHRVLPPGDATFADPSDAFVSLDGHEEEVANFADNVSFYRCDFHGRKVRQNESVRSRLRSYGVLS